MSKPNPIPTDFPAISPFIVVSGAEKALEYYENVLGASRGMTMPGPNGTIGYAEIDINGSKVMVSDECEGWDQKSPEKIGGTPVSLYVYVKDVDAVVAKAVENGATLTQEVSDQFYGDRTGGIVDPFGHKWHIASRVENVSDAEMLKRSADMLKQMEGAEA